MELRKFLDIVSISRNEIYIIIFYSFAIGLLSLALPIAAQGLVTIVSFGAIRQPLFVLTFAVLILLISSGVFRLLQSILIEVFQQRLFAVSALKIAERLPKLQLKILTDYHGTELLNRFFDVITIQKNLSDILLNFTGIVLQSILGMLLLAVYHPALLVFDIIYILLLSVVIIFPFKLALASACQESNAKYDVVAWLEEMVRVPYVFHFQGNATFGIEKADQITSEYIRARQNHYKYIFQHLTGTYVIQAIGLTSLLLVGGLLVLNNQMTLGQLVAAEIIVSSIGSSTIKMGIFLEKIYDLLAATEKVHTLLTLPTEIDSKHEYKSVAIRSSFESAPSLEVSNLVITDTNNQTQRLNFSVKSLESIAFVGYKPGGKSKLIQCLIGLHEPVTGEIYYNNIPLKYYSLKAFRKNVSYIHEIEMFDGTILENILVGRSNIPLDNIIKLINLLHLDVAINKLDDKLDSHIGCFHQPLSSVERMKIMFIRAFISQPYLLVIDGALDIFSQEDLEVVLQLLNQPDKPWTLLVTTRRQDVAKYFERRIFL